jgi:hypothetical protein
LQEARERLERLRSELVPAEREDELALGRALLDDKPEPASKAAQIREEIQAQERRVSALERAHVEIQEQVTSVIAEHKGSWHRETLGEIGKAGRRSKLHSPSSTTPEPTSPPQSASRSGLHRVALRLASPPTTGSVVTPEGLTSRRF